MFVASNVTTTSCSELIAATDAGIRLNTNGKVVMLVSKSAPVLVCGLLSWDRSTNSELREVTFEKSKQSGLVLNAGGAEISICVVE